MNLLAALSAMVVLASLAVTSCGWAAEKDLGPKAFAVTFIGLAGLLLWTGWRLRDSLP